MRMIAADLTSNSFSMCEAYRHGLVDRGSMAAALHLFRVQVCVLYGGICCCCI